ncbi:transposase [Pelagibacterium nitratireducens]|mgnify:CR=1 FL=1|uniref:Transposase n=1 Tax=Pelagibacterium nitratireducens TaxID=1046114 RepID=A0ABZ2IC07_9HYPH
MIEAVPDRMEGAPVARRRRWSDAFKAEMVARCLEPGANVSALAREIGISPSQLFGWRTEAFKRGEVAKRDDDAGVVAAARSERGMIEIVVSDTVVRVGSDVGDAHLRRVIRAVRSA